MIRLVRPARHALSSAALPPLHPCNAAAAHKRTEGENRTGEAATALLANHTRQERILDAERDNEVEAQKAAVAAARAAPFGAPAQQRDAPAGTRAETSPLASTCRRRTNQQVPR